MDEHVKSREISNSGNSKKRRMVKMRNQMLSMVPGGGQLIPPDHPLSELVVKRHVEMSSLTVEECELLGDAKYRTYISQVEKALKSFEYTSEWADLISALGKLNKVLLNHIKFPVVPKKVTIGKRLAQCLHPALPSGVHLKALETYDIIFKCIGTPRLANDLFVYCAGLFPLMGHAAMNVKPSLLGIYEKHFTQLGKQIKPGLNGLLLGLLPGLEEGSEYYDRTNSLLDKFCEAAGSQFFYTCLWECIMTCPSVRLSGTTYLSQHYSKNRSMEDQLYLMGHNIDLMVDATCQAVQDSSVLVQRCILDFLLNAFPMHNAQLNRPDMAKIVNASLCVVLRRDMSLNRRLYAWLLGTDASGSPLARTQEGKKQRTDGSSMSGEMDMAFFNTYSKDKLISALHSYLSLGLESSFSLTNPADKLIVLRPFRIIISLLDKPEIGPVIIEEVLLEVFRCLYRECVLDSKHETVTKCWKRMQSNNKNSSIKVRQNSPDNQVKVELTKTANLLFGALEPYFIWDFIAKTFESVCVSLSKKETGKDTFVTSKELPSLLELCTLVDFLLDIVSLEIYMETTTEHLPDLLRHVTSSLVNHYSDINDTEVTASLKLCGKILQKVQPSMNILGNEAQDKSDDIFAGTEPEKVCTPSSPNIISKVDKDKTDADSAESTSLEGEGAADNVKSENSTGFDIPNEPLKKRKDSNLNQAATADNDHLALQEFQQYNSIEIERSTSRVSYRITGPLTLMQACVQSFQEFFHVFVSQRMLGNPKIAKQFLDYISLSSDKDSKDGSSYWKKIQAIQNSENKFEIETLLTLSDQCCEAFSHACKLLIDFSSFPMYCTDYHKLMDQTFNQGEEMTLPAWLQDLITCTCFVDNFKVQTSAIATMLDLIILTQSIQSETESKDAEHTQRPSVTDGTVSVVILPFLLPKHLHFLNTSTIFYYMVADCLWGCMSGDSPEYHQSSVELFHQLHQVNPSSWVCEDVIGNALIQQQQQKRLDAYKRFTVLWHLTRDKRFETTPGRLIRTYDRSMFVVLDSLKEETNPTQTISSTWVTHSVQRGDLGRILEPILLMLYHPDTARISIQHVNIHQPKSVTFNESDDLNLAEAKIYAISSEGGNVIYHVSAQGKTISKKTAENLKSVALTVMNEKDKSKFVTASTRTQHDMPFERVNADMLNLRVNPFGSDNVLDRLVLNDMEMHGVQFPQVAAAGEGPDLGNIKRLNKETCQKEGIVFEERDHEEESTDQTAEAPEQSGEEIVTDILDDILTSLLNSENTDITVSSEVKPVGNEVFNTVPLRSTRENSVASRDSLSLEDEDLLNAIDRQGLSIDSPSGSDVDLNKQMWSNPTDSSITDIHTLHMHILLYTQKYDCKRTLYALTTLKSLLQASPRLIVVSMATTSIAAYRTPHYLKVQTLLARHRKSVFGKNFFGEVPSETLSSCRSSMYLEVVVSGMLYFVRSYYPNLMMSKLSSEELMGNQEVHILSTEILTVMMSELILITKDSGKSFASYVENLLTKCKLQKALLHCVLASIYNARQRSKREKPQESFTETIVSFNEENLDTSAVETFQIKLLELLQVMVRLEDYITKAKKENESVPPKTNPDWDRNKVAFQPTISHVRYNPALPLVQQGMFVSGVLSALKQQHLAHMHRHWVSMVTTSLPFMGKALSLVVMSVVSQLCRNLEMLSQVYKSASGKNSVNGLNKIPPDHVLTIMEGLTTLCHYCLLDSSPQVSLGNPLPSGAIVPAESANYAGQIIFNLLHVFNPVSGKDSSLPHDLNAATSPIIEARRALLSILPRIIACLATMWKAITLSNQEAIETQAEQSTWTMGSPKIIQRYILEFLSPLSQSHGVSLLGAVAVAWNDRRRKGTSQAKRGMSVPCDDQMLLVELVSEIKVLPTDKLVQIVKQVMKQPPPSELTKNKKSVPLEVNLLQFFFSYIQQTAVNQLIDSWPSLLTLIKDGLQLNLSPPGQFLLLEILNETVQKMPVMEERKSQKELQDIIQKVMDSVSTIAGSCLEQTTWLRRNLAVKPGPQTDIHDVEDGDGYDESGTDLELSPQPERKVILPLNSNSEISKYSVQALTLLAERTASLLDVVYGSEEKEKAVPFLTSIMYNVFPYLRNHSPHNLPSFRACSQFLASISGYQYSRKCWRKEALELLLDSSFFQMDQKCIGFWETIIDNLMTHDKTTFKDLMSRVTVVQSGSLNLFTSKDQEFEQRTLLLKRLAFTIFCSEPDQYQRNMPDIQERLSESLRLPQVPSLMTQVFLCFRVLILRMSPQHLTSLWPTIITEMVHVFLQIEQELSTETDEFKTQLQRIAALDSTWAHLGNGLNAHNNPAWLQLYLSACKLLDLALALPAEVIPQFQLYRWAFIGEDCSDSEEKKQSQAWSKPTFLPHIMRISRLLNAKVPSTSDQLLVVGVCKPLITMTHINSLIDLQPFFNTLVMKQQHELSPCNNNQHSVKGSMSKSVSAPEFTHFTRQDSTGATLYRTIHQSIEQSVEADFLEFLPV